MRLSLVIDKLRQELSDPSSSTNLDWSDAELASILSDQQLVMARRLVAVHEGYHNAKFTLADTAPTQLSSDVWVYTVPWWCMRIAEVRLLQESGATNPRRPVIDEVDQYGGKGWRYAGLQRIELIGFGTAQGIEVLCAKRPARLTKGTLPTQAGMAANQMRLDQDGAAGDATDYPHESLTDSYVNGIFELTGVDVGATPRFVSGQLQRCTASAHGQQEGTTLYTVLTMADDWTTAPTTADTYEMHPEIPDEHLRLLVLLAARAAWTRKGNKDEVMASSNELRQEWTEFLQHLQPRGLQRPKIIKTSITPWSRWGWRHGDDETDFYWGSGAF